jgi:hypothetical protein
LVTRARGAEPCDGFLALESEGSPIEFRRLRLLELEPAGAAAAGAPVEASAAAPEREFPYRRLIALYDGLGLGRWRTLGAQGSFEARDALLSAAGPGELEFEGPIVDWVQRAGAGAERGGAPARGRAARNPRRAARSAAPSECLELSLDFRRLEPSLDLPLRLVGVAWPEAAAALAPVGSWNRLVLRLERPPRPADPAPRGDSAEPANSSDSADGAEAADSANSADLADPAHSAAAARLVVTLNGQRLPDPPPSAACLSADGRLTLAGLALVPGGVPTEFMNLLRLERPPRPADPAPRGDSAEPANSSDSAEPAEPSDPADAAAGAGSANSADSADTALSATAAARLVVTLNGQRLPDPPPSAACLSADGRLTLAGLALVPGGVPTEFMNLLLGEPLSPAQPAALEAIETLRAPR